MNDIKGYIDIKELYLMYKYYCLAVEHYLQAGADIRKLKFCEYAYNYINILNARGFKLALNNRSFSVMI